MRRRGFTLVEVLVALVILATAGIALERLVSRSLASLRADADLTHAMLVARSILAEASATALEPGSAEMEREGLRVAREVRRTSYPFLREIHVRVDAPGGDGCELVEVMRVPQG